VKPFLPYIALLNSLFFSVFSTAALSDTPAGWQVGVGLEAYTWEETIAGSAFKPKEKGSRMALHFGWKSAVKTGNPYFAYLGKIYGGTVDYNTITIGGGVPSPTTTDYSGMVNEIRGVVPSGIMSVVTGLGYDSWSRSLGDTSTATGAFVQGYTERYDILFMRLGLSANIVDRMEISGGVKRTIKNDETLPYGLGTVHPGTSTSPYLEMSYKVGSNFDLAAYYDGWLFGQSRTSGAGLYQPASKMTAFGVKAAWLF